MEDNGLLRYYRQKQTRQNGQLNLSAHPFKVELEFEADYGSVRTMYENNQKYYFKFVNKGEVDAELLLSQVYAKAGFKTAIYTPLDPVGVISQSVKSSGCQTARQFFLSKAFKEKENLSFEDRQLLSNNLLPTAYRDFKNYNHNFTKDCAREYLKMRLFDVATKNSDRNVGNYFFRQNEEEIASEIFLIDYGASGSVSRPYNFSSSLCGQAKNTAEEIIDIYKTNDNVAKFISANEVAEQIGSINVVETAKDIKQTINFEVEQTFVDEIASSMEQTAEALIK